MYKKIVVPVSGKNDCERAKKTVAHAQKICDGEIVFLHVNDPVSNIIGGDAHKELEREEAAKAETLMSPLKEFMKGSPVRYSTLSAVGTLADTIVRVAHEQEADLIAMFTDGRDSASDMLLGTVTERVLRISDIPILVINR